VHVSSVYIPQSHYGIVMTHPFSARFFNASAALSRSFAARFETDFSSLRVEDGISEGIRTGLLGPL